MRFKAQSAMGSLRTLIHRNPLTTALLVVAALCLKALVPAGMMIAANASAITVEICADASGHDAPRKLAIPMKGAPVGSAATGECPFAGLATPALPAVDPALLGLALVFILASGFAPVRTVALRSRAYLRPPLRGPPAIA